MRRTALCLVTAPLWVAGVSYTVAFLAFAALRFVIVTDETWSEIVVDGVDL